MIPDYPNLMQPALQALAETQREMRVGALMNAVAARLGLTREERSRRLPSGSETVLGNRLHWALAYLEHSGSVAQRQGHYRIADTALAGMKATVPAGLAQADAAAAPPELDAVIATSARLLNARLRHDLLDRIHGEPPEFFEHLIIELLLSMGYGCGDDLARDLGRRGDGGIDGAMPQDVLGLDVVYVQAKRYRPGSLVPTSAVREFAGSLNGRKASKGVFVTTAMFPQSAARFVSRVPSKIALIDGPALADLLIGHNIGVTVRQTYAVKQIDEAWPAAALQSPRTMQGEY